MRRTSSFQRLQKIEDNFSPKVLELNLQELKLSSRFIVANLMIRTYHEWSMMSKSQKPEANSM